MEKKLQVSSQSVSQSRKKNTSRLEYDGKKMLQQLKL
jgi:hypothetical protein